MLRMNRSAWAGLMFVFALGVVLRVGWVAVRHGPDPDALTYPDEYAYQLAGRSLAAGHGLIDEFGYRATYMPAYPAFIAAFELAGLSTLAFRVTQAVFAALIAPATFLLARLWMQTVWGAFAKTGANANASPNRCAVLLVPTLAGLAAAVDPFLVFFSGLLLTEAIYAAALILTWWLVLRTVAAGGRFTVANAAAAGLGVLTCVMLRPAASILILMAPAVVVLWGRFSSRAVIAALVTVVVVILGLLPWAARNSRILGEWRWTTTRGGISLYDGLQTGAAGASDLAHTKLDAGARNLSELQWDRYWRDRAIQELRENPAVALKLAGRKFLRTWNIVPNEPEHRRGKAAWVSAAWMALVLISAGFGLWHVRQAARWWLFLLVPVLAFTLLHMVFVGSVRYRIPMMPLVFVLSAVGLARVVFRCDLAEATATSPEPAGPPKEEPSA